MHAYSPTGFHLNNTCSVISLPSITEFVDDMCGFGLIVICRLNIQLWIYNGSDKQDGTIPLLSFGNGISVSLSFSSLPGNDSVLCFTSKESSIRLPILLPSSCFSLLTFSTTSSTLEVSMNTEFVGKIQYSLTKPLTLSLGGCGTGEAHVILSSLLITTGTLSKSYISYL